MNSLSKLLMSAPALASVALAPVAAEAADAWRLMDATSCHVNVAWPYATRCSGARIEKNCGVDCWQDTGGVGGHISLGSNYLWTAESQWQISYMDPDTDEWTAMPMNACGTGAQVEIDMSNRSQHLAVGTDSSGRDVPWIVDIHGTLRFWRTKYNPNCWANAGQVPGDHAYSIGIYGDPNVYPNNTPWIGGAGEGGSNLYLKNGSGWDLLDTFTASVSSHSNQVLDPSGVIWNYAGGGWSVDTSWPSYFGEPAALSSGRWSPGGWVKKALVTRDNHVWMFGQ